MEKKSPGCPRCKQLEQELQRTRLELERTRRQLEQTRRELEELRKQVRELKALLKMNSSNSSMPPSRDPPSAPPRKTKPPSRRFRGAQPGHGKTARELVPIKDVNEVVTLKPESCRVCGGRMRGVDPHPRRHQVFEIPEVKPHITEYQCHMLECSRCGNRTQAALPESVSQKNFGPRLMAAIALLSGRFHLSKRKIKEFLKDYFNMEISLGSISACEQNVSEALANPVEEARRYLESQPVANVDETGWRQNKGKAWLWTASTTLVAVFMIHVSRGSQAFTDLMGSFRGILNSDRWGVYKNWKKNLHQICWAHLERNFKQFLEFSDQSAIIGHILIENIRTMFNWWYKVRDGTLSRRTFQQYMRPLKKRIRVLLEQGCSCPDRKIRNTCREVLELWPALWTFVRVDGVEPTNNAAERDLRTAVLWRKNSFGTDSVKGSRFVERILTVTVTLRKQGRNLLDFVTKACQAKLQNDSPPSLLPAGASIMSSSKMIA